MSRLQNIALLATKESAESQVKATEEGGENGVLVDKPQNGGNNELTAINDTETQGVTPREAWVSES
jgi:hypothetical protein